MKDLLPGSESAVGCGPWTSVAANTKYGFLFSGPVLPVLGVGDMITMPGVDYRKLRAAISMAEILRLIGFVPARADGPQLRGPCPVHGSSSKRSRVFSVNLKTNAYRCFKCGSAGNQLDLYAAVKDRHVLPVHREALKVA